VVGGLQSTVLDPLIASVAAAGNASDLERALTAFSEAWNAWTVHNGAPSEPWTQNGSLRPASFALDVLSRVPITVRHDVSHVC
jgi:hypothetical protein